MKFVSNSSPLIFLAKLDILTFLERDTIVVPTLVREELLAKESVEKDLLAHFFQNQNVLFERAPQRRILSAALGMGETETILIALAKKISHVLIDDRRARSLARLNDLKPKGTLWVILRALREEKINQREAKAFVYDLPKVGFRIDETLWMEVLRRMDGYK